MPRIAHLVDRSPIYAPGNVLLTLRYTCAVAMVNFEQQGVLTSESPPGSRHDGDTPIQLHHPDTLPSRRTARQRQPPVAAP